MTNSINREIFIPRRPEIVWQSLADSSLLCEWLFPNDFEPRVGHRFTFRVPGNPKMKFDGLTVHCEVLECEPPVRLSFSWSAGGAVSDTRVTFRLEPEGDGTHLFFEHSGFDLTQPFAKQAFKGAQLGWERMLNKLTDLVVQQVRNQ